MRTIEESLGAFDTAIIQEFKNIILTIRNDGYDVNDVLKFIENQKCIAIRPIKANCPDCHQRISIYSVNTCKGNQVGGEYKSQWYCEACGYAHFSKETVQEEIHKVRRLGGES